MRIPGSASPKVRFVAAVAAFATLYYVAAELTSSLAGDVGIAVLWPASGVYLGVMLVAPRHLWPALAVGALLGSFAAYSHAGSSPELSLAFAVPSSAEGLLGAVMIERIVRGRFRLGGLHDVSALVLGSAIAIALVALSAGAVAAQTFGVSFAESWLGWWSADALGALALAPLVIAVAHGARERLSGAELRYAACVMVLVGVAVWAQPSGAAAMVGGAIALPVLLWAGWRWGARAAAFGGTGVALAAMNLAAGSDLLGGGAVDSEVHVLQAFLAALLVSSLSFAAAVADWRRERVAAARSSRRLRAVTDSAPDGYVTVDAEGTITGWSARARAMFDLDADDAVGLPLESIAPGVGPITPTPDSRELTLLARNSSGSEFPAALTVRAGIDGDEGLWHVFIRDLTESERLGKELDRAAEELQRRERARDEARTELRGTARELQQAIRRIDDLTAQLDDRDADLGDRDAELRERRGALAAANGELDRAKREAEAVHRELAGAKRDAEATRRELDEAKRATETAHREFAGAKRDAEATRRELAGAKRDAETARREVAGVGSARDHARAEADRNARETDRLRADVARATGELSRVRAELSASAADLSSARASRRALEEKLERTRADHAATARQLEADRAQLAAELHRVGAEHSRSLHALDEATAALAAAEAERALVAKHGSELIARYDERGVCLAASAGARGLLGYEPAELVGRPGADLIHPDDRARLLRARAGQTETAFRARLRRRDGEYVTVEVGFRPAEGQAGRLGEVTTIARPVAERRADDDAGRVAETRFRSLFGTLPGASALVGQDGRIRRANPALARLTGYSADQLEGTALGTLVDDANAPVVGGRLRQVATGQVATLRMEHQLAHSSGRTVAVELRVTPLPPADEAGDGRLHELVVHFQDLSEQRRSQGESPVRAA